MKSLKKINTTHKEVECLVFRTNLQTKTDVERISEAMNDLPGILDWSVDLEDWEKVLRVEGTGIRAGQIKALLRSLHVDISEMPV